jgi:hypothetical protein
LTVEFYAGNAESCFDLYEDEGNGFQYQRGGFLVTRYCQSPSSGGITIKKAEGKGDYRPVERELFLKVFGAQKPTRAQINTGKGFENLAYSYDASSSALELRLKDQIKGFELKIAY